MSGNDATQYAMNAGFQTPTSEDHRPWLWVVTVLSLIYSLLCLAARLLAKWDMFWWDDAILAAAYAIAVVHWGLIFSAISNGLGVATSALSVTAFDMASKLYFGARIPIFLALCLSKLSMLVFTRKIFQGDFHGERIIFSIAYAITGIYGIGSVLLSSVGCRPTGVLVAEPDAVCNSNAARWAIIVALEIFTELLIIGFPIWFISKNELRASKKRIVVFVYSFRVLVAGLSVIGIVLYIHFIRSGASNIGLVPVVVLEEVLLCMSLLTASIPCLKPFVWAFMSRHLGTMYGTPDPSQAQASYALQSSGGGGGGTRRRADPGLNTSTSHRSKAAHLGFDQPTSPIGGNGSGGVGGGGLGGLGGLKLRPERSQYNVNVHASSSREQIISSFASRSERRSVESLSPGNSISHESGAAAQQHPRMVIMRDVDFQVARE